MNAHAEADVLRDLDLSLPAWIEASAGTGKTFTIERIALRLFAEKGLKPSELLLLSFTRKTADELRERLRELLRSALEKGVFEPGGGEPPRPFTGIERKSLRDAHLRCDETAVHTLHGFCQGALQAHALEARLPFGAELRDEREGLKQALEGLLRGAWSREPGFLRALRAAFDTRREDWAGNLVPMALAFVPERGDSLHLRPDPDWLGRDGPKFLAAAVALEEAADALAKPPGYGWAEHARSFKENKTAQAAKDKDPFLLLRACLDGLGSKTPAEKTLDLAGFFGDLSGNSIAFKKGFAAVLPAGAAGDPRWQRLAEACHPWLAARAELRERRKEYLAALGRAERNQTLARALGEIRIRLGQDKRRLGLWSYDDMVSKLAAALRADAGLAAKLGSGFKACIVDEFQDTDPLQWELLRRICLEASPRIPLILVGDPKQAIYGFRGGDLGTYLDARRQFHALAGKGEAQGFPLRTNFRSAPRLVTALNAVFPHPEWFGPSPPAEADPHWHLPVSSAAIAFTSAQVRTDFGSEDERPVILRDFSAEAGNKEDVKRSLRRWIAVRIRDLSGRFHLREMAVLTRDNSEAAALERYLRREGIACRLRRARGCFGGPSAEALRLLLEILEEAADPRAQARLLLLPFLRTGGQAPGLPAECPPLISKWARLAAARRWPEFFRSLLFESGYAYRLAAESGRSESLGLQDLCRSLAAEGLKQGCSLRALRERFAALRDGDAEEASSEAEAGGEGGVSILTLHASKGLEFPVVFLAATSGGSNGKTHLTLREQGRFLHALDVKDPGFRERHARQSLEENQRLLYVGLTRAKRLLFVPLLPDKDSYGPLGGFAGRALRAAAAGHPEFFSIDAREETGVPAEPARDAPVPEWPERDPAEAGRNAAYSRSRLLTSYSHLIRHAPPALAEGGGRWERDEGEDAPAEPAPASALPAGTAAGTALHALLETVDFACAAQTIDPSAFLALPGMAEAVEQQIRRHGLPADCGPEVASLLWHSLRMPIPDPADPAEASFRLADIGERRAEVEFLLRVEGQPSRLPAGVAARDGFLWGFIDLVFRREGRYYLLDWKSNRLDAYDSAGVQASMEEHRYDLQWKLYAVALDRWLTARLPGYDPARHFGGVVYLYLRGAPGAADGFSGYRTRPRPVELRQEYPELLREAMRLS